jgi:hypothetical protein
MFLVDIPAQVDADNRLSKLVLPATFFSGDWPWIPWRKIQGIKKTPI